MNHAFPTWKTASIVLEGYIDNSFGAILEAQNGDITIHWLPSSIAHLIPEEFRGKFQLLYASYVRWLYDFNILGDLSQFVGMNRADLAILSHHLDNKLNNTDIANRLDGKSLLKGVMGIEPYCFNLPVGLTDIFLDVSVRRNMDKSDYIRQPFLRLV